MISKCIHCVMTNFYSQDLSTYQIVLLCMHFTWLMQIRGLCGWNSDDVQERTSASLSASPSNNEAPRPPDLLFSDAYRPSITPIDTSHSSP